MSKPPGKSSLMHNLGAFFGHIAKAVKTDPSKKVIRRETEEVDHGDVVLRRTTIEEIEVRKREDP